MSLVLATARFASHCHICFWSWSISGSSHIRDHQKVALNGFSDSDTANDAMRVTYHHNRFENVSASNFVAFNTLGWDPHAVATPAAWAGRTRSHRP